MLTPMNRAGGLPANLELRGDSNPHGFPHHPLKSLQSYKPIESFCLLNSYHHAKITHSVDLGRFCTPSQEIGHK